jgi:hypothetical protein
MSIQFRSRIRTAVDIKDDIFSGLGVCCLPDGTKSETLISFYDCIDLNGYWQYAENLGDIECPPLSDTGCCCACSNLDNHDAYLNSIDDNWIPEYVDGLKELTQCQCNDIGGVWSPEECDAFTGGEIFDYSVERVYNFCTNGAAQAPGISPHDVLTKWDVRYPNSCCVHIGDGTYADCRNVCNGQQCADFNECNCIEDCNNCVGYYNVYGIGADGGGLACDDTVNPENAMDCSDENQQTAEAQGGSGQESRFDNMLIQNNTINSEENFIKRYNQTMKQAGLGIVSACVENINRNEYSCKLSSIEFCHGYFMGLQEGGSPYNCGHTEEIDMIKTFLKDGTISRSVIDSWQEGEYRIAGRYAGIFNGSGVHSDIEVLGHSKTGIVKSSVIIEEENNDFKSFTKNQYAVIIPETDYGIGPLHEGSMASLKINKRKKSKSDSVWNMKLPLNLFERIRNSFSINGIGKGFNLVVPSKTLLAFMMTKTQKRNAGEIWSEEFNVNAYDSVDVKNRDITRGSSGVFHEMKGTYWSSTLVEGTTSTKPLAYAHKRENTNIESLNTSIWASDIIFASELDKTHRIRLALLVRIV